MKPSPIIQINDLRKIVNGIFDHMENDLDVTSITLEHDYYHTFSSNEMLMQQDIWAKEVTGSLYDDWEFLQPLLKDKDSFYSIMFDKVAPLLRYIAHRVGQ